MRLWLAALGLLALTPGGLQENVRLLDDVPADVMTRVTMTRDTVVFGRRVDGIWELAAQSRATGAGPATVFLRAPAGLVVMSPAFSPDGRLYFESNVRVPAIDGREDSDVWIVERTGSALGVPRPLGAPFATEYNEHYPTADAAGTLCFNSARPGGNGRNDIYCGRLDVSDAPRLVASVSSPDQDAAPWLSAAGDTLWFASNRPGGLGGWDLYVSRKERAGDWSAPRNVGAPVNSADNETWVSTSASGEQMIFRRTPTDGGGGRVYVTAVPAVPR
jgi:hypothetical protein